MKNKQLVAIKDTTKVVYRFIGKLVYLKGSHNAYFQQLADQIMSKGGSVVNNAGWLKCDLFGGHTEAKLGSIVLDLTKTSDEAVQETLVGFFKDTLELSGFECTITEI